VVQTSSNPFVAWILDVPAKKEKQIVKMIGKRLKELPGIDAAQALPPEIEQSLRMLRRAEVERRETCHPAPGADEQPA